MSDHEIGRSKAGDDRRLSDQEKNQRLRSLLTPLVNDLVRATPAHPHDPTRRVHQPGHDPSPTPSTLPSCNHTDLPLPQSGSSGSSPTGEGGRQQPTAADLMEILDQTLVMPVAPPLRDLEPQVVVRWVEAASEALLHRRERRRLVREVLRVLDEEWATAEAAKRLREQIATCEAARRRREAGTYWQHREAGRRSQRPVRVEVDSEAWRRAKEIARQLAVGLGEYVGQVVRDHLATPLDEGAIARLSQTRRRQTTRERIYLRIDVSSSDWDDLVARARNRRTTLLRYLGALVEATVWEECELRTDGRPVASGPYDRTDGYHRLPGRDADEQA